MIVRLAEALFPPHIFFSLYLPLVGAGIRVLSISSDYREIRVRLRSGVLQRNYMGVHFGGSLYSMTDPFYMMMLMKNLGPEYVVWDYGASVRFLLPVSEPVFASFQLDQGTIDSIREAASGGDRVIREFPVTIKTASGEPVAEVKREVYIRLKTRAGEREPARATAGVPVQE